MYCTSIEASSEAPCRTKVLHIQNRYTSSTTENRIRFCVCWWGVSIAAAVLRRVFCQGALRPCWGLRSTSTAGGSAIMQSNKSKEDITEHCAQIQRSTRYVLVHNGMYSGKLMKSVIPQGCKQFVCTSCTELELYSFSQA